MYNQNKASNPLLVYGIHAIEEAVNNGKDIQKVLLQRGISNPAIEHLLQLCKHHQIPFQYVPKEKFFAYKNKNHQGAVAYISPISYHNIEMLLPQLFEEGIEPFILILDKVTDTRNFGAIARSAYCAGVHAIVVPFADAAPVTDDAIKTSAGALLQIPVCREKNLKTVVELMNQSGLATLACSEKASKNLQDVDLTGPLAIVMGNEEKGISPDIMKRCTYLAKIPLEFGVQSLNVSVACGIALYEAVRQRI
ncbi:MAG: 23S rRNA (guanosine(2251)-2'-O)-methyltransferase RlmB [Bacteroidetes bacterium]|nr:23S rRNA (guanosine(2251)-2'-O)-methyltransferase RlmB [Bacteroidota bacterium]